MKGGTAVLRQKVGTARLQTELAGGRLALLCELEVKKNRITTVTVSALERPPRCQCKQTGGDAKGRSCVG